MMLTSDKILSGDDFYRDDRYATYMTEFPIPVFGGEELNKQTRQF